MSNKQEDFTGYHIGIFDSGLGGQAVAANFQTALPNIKITTLADRKNIPYGAKTPDQMLVCVKPLIEQFEDLSVDAIVIACNTCFINLQDALRQLTDIPLIGFEPPLEDVLKRMPNDAPLIVCATRGTLKSLRWQALKDKAPATSQIIDIDCTDWVSLLETDTFKDEHLSFVVNAIQEHGVRHLILGCTHYHWLKSRLLNALPEGYTLNLYEATSSVLAELKGILSSIHKD